MARNTVDFTITDEGRDCGKVFRLTEMSAHQGEKWAMRALLALMGERVDIPKGFEKKGMSGLAEVGLKMFASLKWETAEPLIDEMMQCVQFIPDPAKPQIVRKLFPEDVEEIATYIKLRSEVLNLHVGFSQAVAGLISQKKQTAAKSETL